MSRALLIRPAWPVSPAQLERCLASLAANLPGVETTVADALPPGGAESFDIVAFIRKDEEDAAQRLADGLPAGHPLRVYQFDFTFPYMKAQLVPVREPDPAAFCPSIQSHTFNRLAPAGSGFFYYFPYGYLFRAVGLGPLNDYGFRISIPLGGLEKRPATHKVVAVFGGSAAWSLDCLPHEMFAARLEVHLNRWAEETGSPLTFTVLNFAQNGHVVLNEMFTWMLFCDRIKPDLAIAHDGFNDICYGLVQDPTLLARDNICYQNNLEEWSQILHDTKDRPTSFDGDTPIKLRNPPQNVIRAYVTRKRQFHDMVRATGARFLWGLQPMLHSKQGGCSATETQYLEQCRPFEVGYARAFEKMKEMYEIMLRNVPLARDYDFVDFHRDFAPLGAEDDVFVDFVHTSPAGDERIARTYARIITDKIATDG